MSAWIEFLRYIEYRWRVGLYFFSGSIEFARMSWLVMFGSSRYVVNRRGPRGSPEPERNLKNSGELRRPDDGDVDRLCTWRIPTKFTRNLEHIVSHKTDTTERRWSHYPCVCFLPLFRLYRVFRNSWKVEVANVSLIQGLFGLLYSILYCLSFKSKFCENKIHWISLTISQ